MNPTESLENHSFFLSKCFPKWRFRYSLPHLGHGFEHTPEDLVGNGIGFKSPYRAECSHRFVESNFGHCRLLVLEKLAALALPHWRDTLRQRDIERVKGKRDHTIEAD